MGWNPQGIDGVFFITITTLLIGFFGMAIKYCLKSKCENFDCCFGLFHVVRRVDLETQTEMAMMEMGIEESKSDKNIVNLQPDSPSIKNKK